MAFDFNTVSVPFRMQPGLRRLPDGAAQLTPTTVESAALKEKLSVLTRHADQALLSTPGFDATAACQALQAHALVEHPDAFAWDGARRFHSHGLGWGLVGNQVVGSGAADIGACLRALPDEVRLAGLLSLSFAEDFAVIDGDTGHIPWLAVCLPSHWAPEDKVGRHFAQVHAPVADNQLLLSASDHLARLVTLPQRWERFVWTITRQERLDAHPRRCSPRPWPTDVDADGLAHGAFFRTERQTFIPLPAHRQAIFTIHVELQPLHDAVRQPQHAGLLHDALASMSPNVLAYRSLTPARDSLLQWLSARARGDT